MANFSREITEEFLNEYKKFERIKNDKQDTYEYFYSKYRSLFETFRTVRNNLAHNLVHGDYPIAVSDGVLEELIIMNKKMRYQVSDKMIPLSKLTYFSLNDSLVECVLTINRYNYSLLPILDENKRLLGVVNEKSILNTLINEKEKLMLDDSKTINDFIDYFGFDQNPRLYYLILSKNTQLFVAQKYFTETRMGEKRCGGIFITEHGKKQEAILGLLTQFDAFKED